MYARVATFTNRDTNLVDELTGADLGGRSITVNEARPRQPRNDRGGSGGPRCDDRGGQRRY